MQYNFIYNLKYDMKKLHIKNMIKELCIDIKEGFIIVLIIKTSYIISMVILHLFE